MHELGITQNILEIASRHAQNACATRVTGIHIKMGRLSSFMDESIQFYWDILSRETICSDAKIHFERVPAKMVCLDCAHQFTLDSELEPCPKCKSVHIKVIAGDELLVDYIDVE